MISECDNANDYPWTDPKSPYPRLRDYVTRQFNLALFCREKMSFVSSSARARDRKKGKPV